MKKIVLLAALIVAVSLASYARKPIAEGKTNSPFGDYKIQVDNKSVWINGKEHKPFVITYENSNLEVRVAVDMDRQGKKYYVLSDNLSVQYVSNRHYFGVEKLDKVIEKDGFRTSDAALNRVEYFHQKAITTGYSWRRDNTKLIAAYFPMLLNNPENLIAEK
jgi:hypothetical protein